MRSHFLDSESESELEEIAHRPPLISRSSTALNRDSYSPASIFEPPFDLPDSIIFRDSVRPNHARNTNRPRPMSLYPVALECKTFHRLATPVSMRPLSAIRDPMRGQSQIGLNANLEQDITLGVVGSRYDTQTLPGLQPCLNRRDSRSCGTDFGLGRNTGAINFDTNRICDDWSVGSNSGSIPLTTRTGTDSDGAPSLYDINTFDFPEPPPIGSPVIRRMRSSPWFMAATEVDRNRSFSGNHRRTMMTGDELLRSRLHSCSPDTKALLSRGKEERTMNTSASATRCTKDQGKFEVGKGRESHMPFLVQAKRNDLNLELGGEAFHVLEVNMPHPKRLQRDESKEIFMSHASAPDLLPWSSSNCNAGGSSKPTIHISRRKERGNLSQYEAQDCRPLGPLPRIIRKVTSMKLDLQKMSIHSHDISSSTGRTIPKARSFLRPSDEKHAVSGASEVGIDRHSSICLPETNSKRKHLSGPLTSLGVSYKDQELPNTYDGTPRGLASHFLHRSTDKNAFRESSIQEQAIASTSFIDFTLDQDTRFKGGAKRDRVKNFIVKASNGLLGWGKRKAKKSSVS